MMSISKTDMIQKKRHFFIKNSPKILKKSDDCDNMVLDLQYKSNIQEETIVSNHERKPIYGKLTVICMKGCEETNKYIITNF